MKQLNVAISDSVYAAAKNAADRSGMLLRRWVEDAIAAKADTDARRAGLPDESPDHTIKLVPFEQA